MCVLRGEGKEASPLRISMELPMGYCKDVYTLLDE